MGLSTWPRRRKLRLTISWRGGAESWWLVEARGCHGVFPGHRSLEDVAAEVCSEARWVDDSRPKRVPPQHPNGACLYCGASHLDGPCQVVD
jgi:hypothetical protein